MAVFSLGTIEISPAASAALAAVNTEPEIYLSRHQSGDWGEVDEAGQQDNDFAVRSQQAVCSTYRLSDGSELCVLTDADRSSTLLFLATEGHLRKVSTRKGYAAWAAIYDTQKNALIAAEEPYVDAIAATLPITRALDVGTGTGRHALKLARRGIPVSAVDQSPEMLAIAQDAARKEGLAIDFRLASLDNDLPFDSAAFDFLICALMLCHVPNLAHAVQEFARVLQPGGHLLITDFHPEAIERGWRTDLTISGIRYWIPNVPHTRAGYLEALTNNGFTILRTFDILLGEAPEGYVPEAVLRENGDKTVCFIVLAQKPLNAIIPCQYMS